MNANQWLHYFKTNSSKRNKIPWERGVNLPPRARRALGRSWQRFQVGESGDGRHIRKAASRVGEPDYEEAIDLFVKEEQGHADLFACALKLMNIPLLRFHWSDFAFVTLRRMLGLRHELLVLLLPEMIAKRYFRALRDGLDDEVVKAICDQVCHDEEGHVAFHVETLRFMFGATPVWQKGILVAMWKLLYRISCLVVIWDHRGVLRESGVQAGQFYWDCMMIFDETAASIFNSAVPMRQHAWLMSARRGGAS